MDEVTSKTGLLTIKDSSDFSGSYDGDSHSEDEDEVPSEDATCPPNPPRLKSRELHSWASEMSLYDIMTPRRTMGPIKMLSTPSVVPTPHELKEVNWKTVQLENKSDPQFEVSPPVQTTVVENEPNIGKMHEKAGLT